MAYCTPDDVEEILGRPLEEHEAVSLEIYLEIIADLIDGWIEDAGMDPANASTDRKKKVSILMGEQAVYAIGVDPFVSSESMSSGDSSASVSRGSSAADRFLRPQKLYFQLLGIKHLSITSARIHTSWR